MIRFIFDMAKRFHKDEKGIALTEYLVLLGLLVAGVILAVIAFGGELSDTWNSWGGWLTDEVAYQPSGG